MFNEPTDVGPLYGGDQAVLGSDRQLVVNLLMAAHADGRLADGDFSHRMITVQAARVFDDLVTITRDLMRS